MTGAPGVKDKSQNAKMAAARLMAVQALYQTIQNGQTIPSVIEEYLRHRAGMDVDGEKMVLPDGILFEKILNGVDEMRDDLDKIIRANSKKVKREKEIEPLLRAILFCGVYELVSHQDIDSPVIINDYLNVTHAFYEKGEVAFINGALDAIAKNLRH